MIVYINMIYFYSVKNLFKIDYKGNWCDGYLPFSERNWSKECFPKVYKNIPLHAFE